MKIKVITFGCSNNQVESEIMMGLLQKGNHEISEDKEDICIVNMCSVKGPSINKGIKAIKQSKTPVVLTGCIPPESVEELKKIRPDLSLMNTHNIDKVVEVIEKTKKGYNVTVVTKDKKIKVGLPKLRKNPIVNIVPISSGCLCSCTYCSVKFIKGRLFSYEEKHILNEIKESIKEGCKEIWLTSQDTGPYGMDKGSTLPKLLKSILALKGDFKVRLGMSTPNYVNMHIDSFIEILHHPKLFKFLHLPVQSGSDKVLWQMKRPYSISQYKTLVKKLKTAHPDLTIATDIIVGFPTESKEDYNKTIELIKETKPEIINISKFWLRPGTEAETLELVPGEIIKKRSTEIKHLFEEITKENNKIWLNWEGEILIDEKGKNNSSIGRNYAYKPVVIQEDIPLGKKVKVKVINTTTFDLRGEIIA